MTQQQREFGKLRMWGNEVSTECFCDALAHHYHGYDNLIEIVSFAGPSSSVKAMSAALTSKKRIEFRFSEMVGRLACDSVHGYNFHRTQVGRNAYHCLAIARRPGLLTNQDDATLWQALRSEQFTTPLLRHWVPEIRSQLKERDALTKLTCFGCDAAVLDLNTVLVDEIVSEGIKAGRLTFVQKGLSNAG